MKFFITIKIATLNIFRNLRRSLITFLTIMIGTTALITSGGFMDFSFEGLRESTIRTQLGHFQITKFGYRENGLSNPYNYIINNYKDLENEIKTSVPDVQTVTERLYFNGLISSNNQTFSALFVGITPEQEQGFNSFETIVDGKQIENSQSNQAVVGSELAKALAIKVNDVITILTNTTSGMVNAVDIKIVGIASTGSADYDKVFVKVPLLLAQKALNTKGVQSIVILLNNTESMNITEKSLQNILTKYNNQYEFSTWYQLAEFYNGVVNLYNGFFSVFEITIFIIVFFSIYNTVSMSIFERTREIGTLRAIGISKFSIIKIFILEGFIMGVLGAILGVLLSFVVAYSISFIGGIEIAAPPGQTRGYTAFINLVPYIIFKTVVGIIIASTISCIIPSFSGVRKSIIKALNYV